MLKQDNIVFCWVLLKCLVSLTLALQVNNNDNNKVIHNGLTISMQISALLQWGGLWSVMKTIIAVSILFKSFGIHYC